MNSFQKELTSEIMKFISERNWAQFHTGKDIAMCLSIESNEILELFLWKNSDSVNEEKLKNEIGDAFYSLLLLANRYNIDIEEALLDKMQLNESKYPVMEYFGINRKYTDDK